MSNPLAKVTTAFALLSLTACGAGAPANSSGGGQMASGAPVASVEVRACQLFDLPSAQAVLGAGTEHPGGDMERDTCVYSSPGVAMLMVQLSSAQFYDQVTISPPHTAVPIGDGGRHNVQASGATAVQFLKGDYSVTMSVQPIGSPAQDYLPPLLNAAQAVAAQLP